MPQSISGISRFTAALFDGGGLEEIFRHVRNIITASIVMGAGVYAIQHPDVMNVRGVFDIAVAGYIVSLIGATLFALNLLDGLSRLSKFRRRVIFPVSLVIIYLFVTLRVAQLVLSFRTG